MKLRYLSVLLLLAQTGFAQTDTTKAIFRNDTYQVQYPNSWRLDTSHMMGTEFFLFAPTDNATDAFSENVNAMVQDFGGQSVSFEEYKEVTEKQLADFATDAKILESKIIKTSSKEFYRITYTMTQGKFQLKMTSICFIKNGKGYLLTFTAEVSNYDKYKSKCDEILGSFKLLK
jgi:PsbP